MEKTAGYVQANGESRPLAGVAPEMDDLQFSKWTNLLERRIGLFIAPERKSFLASGLRSRMRVTGCQKYSDYYHRLARGSAEAMEWSLLIDCLTVHETCFFRHESSMKLVKEVVLPAALQQARSFHAWSVGCASGEEAYSLAMLVDACILKQTGARYFGITGTDISLPSLQHARTGKYLKRRWGNIPETFRHEYCDELTDQHFQIKAGLRGRVCFTQLNLRDVNKAPLSNQHLIYCQNLLIYYDLERRVQIVNRLANFLAPGGMLILGPGELLNWKHPDMERVRYKDTLAYRRAD